LPDLIKKPDAMQAMLKMKKLDIAELERAAKARTKRRGFTMSTAAQQEVTTPVKAATGDFVWHELRTTDAKGAQDFYTHVVGWQAKPSGDPGGMPYTLLSVGDLGTAGLMQLTPDMLASGMRPCLGRLHRRR
jgi:hypothetical protein